MTVKKRKTFEFTVDVTLAGTARGSYLTALDRENVIAAIKAALEAPGATPYDFDFVGVAFDRK